MPEADKSFPLASILLQLSSEITAAGDMVNSLEEQISALTQGQTLSVQVISKVQEIDLLKQTLQCLAIFTANVAKANAKEWKINPSIAAEKLDLGALASRLSVPGQIGDKSGVAKSGIVSLF